MSGPDLHDYVRRAEAAGELVVQPRMGMASPRRMSAGLRAVAAALARTVGTITLDSYTRVGDQAGARAALAKGWDINGFPIVVHGVELTSRVAASVGGAIPVQVRHGSADPRAIFAHCAPAGLLASEGGPVSYCLPYGRTPLTESVAAWREASARFAQDCRAEGGRAHLETFGGCLMGQLCPPSLLVALSVLEALFFVQHGLRSVSLSLTQQNNEDQDIEALAALRTLAAELLPADVDWHVVLYAYMGMYPATEAGALRMLDAGARLAVLGGAQRLIVKTVAEAHRIPTVAENIQALERAARTAAAVPRRALPSGESEVLIEARALVEATLGLSTDIGTALISAFAAGLLDVPYCVHQDNQGRTQAGIDASGRLRWTRTGNLPLPRPRTRHRQVTAAELLTLLRFGRDHCDQTCDQTCDQIGDQTGVPPWRVAVVGSGPRGIAVLERVVARLAEAPACRPVELYLIDAVEVGAGRIWRTDQPGWFLMNTVAGEVTMFSGPADDGGARAGAGPTLAQWWQADDPHCPGPNGYAPRSVYGRYLRFVTGTLARCLPEGVTLHQLRATVIGLTGNGHTRTLRLADGTELVAEAVVLATGHPVTELADDQRPLAEFATGRTDLRYLRGDSASDIPLTELSPDWTVGILGLGLSYYDVITALTVGRGGEFTEVDGELRYRPCGREPRLVAGSRSGVPMLARGDNQKAPGFRYRPALFTHDRIGALRARGRLDFDRDVAPWLLAEVRLVYYGTELRARFGADAEELFRTEASTASGVPDIERLARRFGVGDLPPLRLDALARPFSGRCFAGRAEFDAALCALLRADIAEARRGNVAGPLKAALDTIRDTRAVLRRAIDFAGLTPASHRHDFLARFVPIASALSAGPPRLRVRQTLALIESGVLRLIGPDARFTVDRQANRFRVSSARVAGASVPLDAVVDARVPVPDVRRDPAPLTRALYTRGRWCSYVNRGAGERFDTGGVAVTPDSFHPINAAGNPDPAVFVLGIPTEHTRWFTQVGSGRPGPWGEFTQDADTIAAAVLAGVESRAELEVSRR